MYEAVTNAIRIRVEPKFIEDQSSPEDGYYFWSYTIFIENMGDDPVQLRTRHWKIMDSNGHTEEVDGAGVIGLQPVIEPGSSFSYTSGAPLRTASGVMMGHYRMKGTSGESFDVEIPAFSLDSPYVKPLMN